MVIQPLDHADTRGRYGSDDVQNVSTKRGAHRQPRAVAADALRWGYPLRRPRQRALAAKDYEQAYEKLTRAQAIVAEMDNGLREEINAKLCQRMRAIYGFLYNKLIDGNINKDLQAIDDALKILRFERQTWVMLMEKVAATRAEQPEADQMLEPQPGSLCLEG